MNHRLPFGYMVLFTYKREGHAVRAAACFQDFYQVNLYQVQTKRTKLLVHGHIVLYDHNLVIAKCLHIASMSEYQFARYINDFKSAFFQHLQKEIGKLFRCCDTNLVRYNIKAHIKMQIFRRTRNPDHLIAEFFHLLTQVSDRVKIGSVYDPDRQCIIVKEPEVSAFKITGAASCDDRHSDFFEFCLIYFRFFPSAGFAEMSHDSSLGNTPAKITRKYHKRLIRIRSHLYTLYCISVKSCTRIPSVSMNAPK